MAPKIYDDKEYDYYIVMEQTSPEDNKIEILSEISKNTLSFLRFSTCLQSFNGRNRNKRLWKAEQVKAMLNDSIPQELIAKGSFVGENGHPVPSNGKETIERILTIDPNNCSHRIISLDWKSPTMLHGIVETLDEGPGTPGYRFMRNILQGIIPSFSLRSLVPQRKNADGSIDVIGVGRIVCYDRVYIPSHSEAYMDVEIPVKNIVTKSKFESVMESYCDFVTAHSNKFLRIVDDLEPAMESAYIDPKSKMISVIPLRGEYLSPQKLNIEMK
jgi:hypothetical protein